MITSKSPFEINWPLVIHYFGQLYLKFPRNYNFLKPFFSEEIADVKTELEEEGFTSDEAVKLIQQVYRKIGGFDNKSKEHSYPVHEKVSGQFSSNLFFIKFSTEQVSLELMFKELNPLAAILHAYAGGLIFMK